MPKVQFDRKKKLLINSKAAKKLVFDESQITESQKRSCNETYARLLRASSKSDDRDRDELMPPLKKLNAGLKIGDEGKIKTKTGGSCDMDPKNIIAMDIVYCFIAWAILKKTMVE